MLGLPEEQSMPTAGEMQLQSRLTCREPYIGTRTQNPPAPAPAPAAGPSLDMTGVCDRPNVRCRICHTEVLAPSWNSLFSENTYFSIFCTCGWSPTVEEGLGCQGHRRGYPVGSRSFKIMPSGAIDVRTHFTPQNSSSPHRRGRVANGNRPRPDWGVVHATGVFTS